MKNLPTQQQDSVDRRCTLCGDDTDTALMRVSDQRYRWQCWRSDLCEARQDREAEIMLKPDAA